MSLSVSKKKEGKKSILIQRKIEFPRGLLTLYVNTIPANIIKSINIIVVHVVKVVHFQPFIGI